MLQPINNQSSWDMAVFYNEVKFDALVTSFSEKISETLPPH